MDTHVYIDTYIHTYIHRHTHIYTYLPTCIPTYIYTYIAKLQNYFHMSIYTYVHSAVPHPDVFRYFFNSMGAEKKVLRKFFFFFSCIFYVKAKWSLSTSTFFKTTQIFFPKGIKYRILLHPHPPHEGTSFVVRESLTRGDVTKLSLRTNFFIFQITS